ncbi:MAG: hypothetical protein D4S01_07150 [Dehalococcoidia bacterium]|nr:MAG: hypothetical protein D4S01_07150 [Dehalococcoidia bacterium]
MPVRKWLVVAKNEYRLHTSSIRMIRPYFLYLIIVLLAVYVAFIAPVVVSPFIDDFLAFIITQAAVPMVQIMLFMFFFYLIVFPISDTLREVQTGQLEIFLAAPIKPSDVLLGEFLGVMPFYAIAITVITGSFTALLTPLGLDMVQIAIIIMTFIITLLSAFWIGIVIAAILRTKLGKTTRGKDVGRALAVVIVLPMIALMYAILGGGLLEALVDPGTSGMVRAILGLLPSSWGAELFVSFASNPGNIAAVGFETLTRFGGLIAFFVAVLWLGSKAANRAYSLEPTTFIASRAKPDGFFYKTVRSVGGGGSFGTLLTSIFKDYSRRLENLSWIAYAVGLVAMIGIFFSDPTSGPEDPLVRMSELGIPLLAGFVVGTVSRGKTSFFMYMKSPSGVAKFVKARLLQGWLVTVPIAAVVVAVSTILVPQITLTSLLTNIIWGSLRTVAAVAFLLGLALVIPVFSEGSRERNLGIVINIMIAVFATIGLDVGFSRLGLSFESILPNLNPLTGLLGDHLLQTTIFSVAGIVLLYVGTKKLSRIE